MEKTLNEHGKEVQRKTCPACGNYEDQSQKYKGWLRKVNTGDNGIWVDIDLLKVDKRHNGTYYPKAITDLTFAKSHTKAYLKAIADRWFKRDEQGRIFQGMGMAMNVPAFLVAYGEGKVSVMDINSPGQWETYTIEEWAEMVNYL